MQCGRKKKLEKLFFQRKDFLISKELPFIILYIEEYKNSKHLTGKEVVDLFNKYEVFDYIRSFYEVLHTTGSKYIVNDIDVYIKSCQKSQ
ncbi:MAG: DUF3791 domain-containing protein [Candidatus Caccosoma sp.]|nr:DUF3791 domain-containing protein [Candidatus Caccosoma sp.]